VLAPALLRSDALAGHFLDCARDGAERQNGAARPRCPNWNLRPRPADAPLARVERLPVHETRGTQCSLERLAVLGDRLRAALRAIGEALLDGGGIGRAAGRGRA